MGDGSLSSWQGCNPGEPSRLTALIEGCGLRARPLRQPRGWGYHRMTALGTIIVVDAAPPPPQKIAEQGSASTLAFELSDGSQRLVVNCGGPGPMPSELPEELVQGLRTTAAHSTLILADTNSTNILADGALGKGVEDVSIERNEDNDSSRLEASHDGYVRSFGLVHKRNLMLGNDGKEIRGADHLIPKGRKKIRELAAYAVRFTWRRESRRPSPPMAWARSSVRRVRRRGTSAAAAAISRPRKGCGSTAAANRTVRCSLSSSGKFLHWAVKSAGSSAAPANQKDQQ